MMTAGDNRLERPKPKGWAGSLCVSKEQRSKGSDVSSQAEGSGATNEPSWDRESGSVSTGSAEFRRPGELWDHGSARDRAQEERRLGDPAPEGLVEQRVAK